MLTKTNILTRSAWAPLACGLALMLANASALAASDSSRYRCTLVDGGVHIVAGDLARSFPSAVATCEKINVQVEFAGAFTNRFYGKDGPGTLDRLLNSVTTIEAPMGTWPRGKASKLMPSELAALVNEACTRHRLDPALVTALIYVESRYQVNARSPKGAMGLMQLMPATASRYGVLYSESLFDPKVNIDAGVRYLRDLHRLFDGRTDLVLAAYNAGEGAVKKYGNRIPPYPETQSYVQQIMAITRGQPAAL